MKNTLRYPLFAVLAIIFSACKSQSYSIETACERTAIGNYRLKWDSYPAIRGDVLISVSDSPSSFDNNIEQMIVKAEDGVATYITKDNFHRKFFRFYFPSADVTQITAARSLHLDDNSCLWDLGGFYNIEKTHCTQWGQLYFTHRLSDFSTYDRTRFKALNIKKEIILCGRSQCKLKLQDRSTPEKICIPPDVPFAVDSILHLIQENKIDRSGVRELVRNLYLSFVNERETQFSRALRLLSAEQNRPLLLESCDIPARVGFLSAMILSICGVPENEIISNFGSSYDPATISQWRELAQAMTIEQQIALTALTRPNEEYLSEALNLIRSHYGSVSNYLTKHLDFGVQEQDSLKQAVLVQAYDRTE